MNRRDRRAERQSLPLPPKAKDTRKETKMDHKSQKWSYKVSKTQEKTQLISAKATRLKWLVILIGLLMAGFGAFKAGIFGG